MGRTRATSRWRPFWRPLTTITFLLLAWWLAGITNAVNPLFLPKLEAVVAAGSRLLGETALYGDVWATLFRALAGLLISFVLAIPLGLIFGRSQSLYEFFEFPVDFLRSIPTSALFFLFILVFGIGNSSKIAVVVYGCAPILLVGSIYGARPTREKEDRINMLRAFGATKLQIFSQSVVRDALPQIATAVRVSASLSLVLVIVTEMFLGANDGLGHRLYDYYLAYRIPEMYVVLLSLGLLGYGLNRVAIVLEQRFTFWKPIE